MSRSRTAEEFTADVLAEALHALDAGFEPLRVVGGHLADRLRADTFSIGRLDLVRRQVEMEAWPEVADRDLMVACSTAIPSTHPVLGHWMLGAADVACVSRLVNADKRRWEGSAAYSLLSRGLGCTEAVGMRLNDGTEVIEMMGFVRPDDFTDGEIHDVEMLQRPTIALHRHARRLSHWRGDARAWATCEAAQGEFGLTARELEVLVLLSEGLLASTIASRLVISIRTVHRHLSNIYTKLGTHDRLSAVMLATSRDIIPMRVSR